MTEHQYNASAINVAQQLVLGAVTSPGALTTVGVLLAILHKVFRAYEFVSFLRWLFGLLPTCSCCLRRLESSRKPRSIQNWERPLGTQEAYDLERELRFGRHIRKAWSNWSRLSRDIKKNISNKTWQGWNILSTRLKAHPWRIYKNQRL